MDIELKKKKSNLKKIILGSFLGILIGSVFGVTVAMFSYNATSLNNKLIAGDIYMRYKETSAINLSGAMPSSTYPTEASGNYFEFQIMGKNTSSKDITYNVKLAYGDSIQGKDRISDQYLLFKLVEVVNNEEQTPALVEDQSFDTIPGATLYTATIPYGTNNEVTRTFRVYARISENVGIGTNTTYTTQEWNNLYASVKINVDGGFVTPSPTSIGKSASELVTELVTNNTATVSETTRYVTGTSENNYLWYSGFLWRIVSYDIDGSNNITNVKLITQNPLITIYYGSDTSFSTSYVKTWLNEDFYDILYNGSNIIKSDSVWNDGENNTTAPVGLLSESEYTSAGGSSSYLNIGYDLWTLTATNNSYVSCIKGFDGSIASSDPMSSIYSVRPSVNLLSTINFTGTGSLSNPYKIVGDIDIGTTGENLNTRQVGEYVNFKDKLFRIVGIENNNTKLVSVDYVRDTSGNVLNKKFASSKFFGSSISDDTYWDGYLNTTWLNKNEVNTSSLLLNNEKDLYLTEGTYYTGEYSYSIANYKATICTNTTVKVSECTSFVSNHFTGYVGLLRVGEIFSAQEGNGWRTSQVFWLITPASSQFVSSSYFYSFLGWYTPTSSNYAVRPSIYLKSNIKIAQCSTEMCDGTKNHPYVVGL